MRELPKPTFNIDDTIWESLTENLLKQHFQYGRQALYPVISCMVTDLQTVCEIYRSYPDTCMNLLEQAMMAFSKDNYENMVIASIEEHCDEEPALWPLVDSLRNLRKYIGDYPSELAKTFHREIAMLPGEQKTQLFCNLVESMCRKLTKNTVYQIKEQTLTMQVENLKI